MAEGKKSALIYCDLINVVEKMKDVDAGKLFKHFLRYINDQNPEAPNQIVEIVFEPIKQQLKRDLKRWENISEKNREKAEKRWSKEMPKNAAASNGIKKDAKNADTDTVTDTDNDTVTVIPLKGDLIEIFFNDLENSSEFEKICRALNLSRETLLSHIPEFRKKAELSYPTFQRFCGHFKNYVNTVLNTKKEKTSSGITRLANVHQNQKELIKQKHGITNS